MTAAAWDTNNGSQFQIRRRACVAGSARPRGSAAILAVATTTDADDLRRALTGQGLELNSVTDPAEALLAIGRTCPDAVVLAPLTGRLAPEAFLEIVRAQEPDLPVVVGVGPSDHGLAARAAALGAAVLGHPLAPGPLLQLLGSLVHPARRLEARPPVLDLGRLRIDSTAPRIWLDGTLIKLPLREHLVLRYLAERADTVITRRELVTALWGHDDERSDNSLSVHVLRLRRRLTDAGGDGPWIEAIRGLGYQFTLPGPGATITQ